MLLSACTIINKGSSEESSSFSSESSMTSLSESSSENISSSQSETSSESESISQSESIVTPESSSEQSSSEQSSSEESSSEESSSSSEEQVVLKSISLNTELEELFVGQSYELSVSYEPDVEELKGVSFVSSDTSVLSVTSDGVVTALSKGSAKITAISTYNSHIEDSATFVVKELINSTASISLNATHTKDSSWTGIKLDELDSDGVELSAVKGTAIYGTGAKSIRVGASRGAGSISFTFSKILIKGVKLHVAKYGSDNASIKVTTDGENTSETKTIGDNTVLTYSSFQNDFEESTTLTVASASASSCRFYLSGIELETAFKEAVYPTSISVSGSSEINEGKTTQLKVSYLPTNTNQKIVSFASDDTSVATVDETGLVTAVSEGSTQITVSAITANGSKTYAYHTITVSHVELDKWTIMIYMCGSNLESGYDSETGQYSDSYLASSDLDEIKSVKNQPDDVNIIVEAGGSKRWDSSYSSLISASKLNRFHLENNKYVLDERINKASMGESSTFQSFLEWGLTNYPAQKTAVILWNHGGGLHGVCNDENYGDDSLLDNEALTAIKGAFKNTGTEKLEWIGYDACLMQVQDVAEFNSPYFNYMVGSQESEVGYGWDYDNWVDNLYKGDDTETILTEIGDTFIDDNGGVNATGSYYEGYYYPCDQTLSFLNLNYMDEYLEAWENMALALKSKITSSNASTFRKNVVGKTKYFADSDYYYFCEFDAYHFLTILANNSTFNPGASYINAVKEAFNNLVVHNCVQKESAHDAYGLSMFFVAGTSYGQKNLATSTYSNFTNWNSINTSFGGSFSTSYNY